MKKKVLIACAVLFLLALVVSVLILHQGSGIKKNIELPDTKIVTVEVINGLTGETVIFSDFESVIEIERIINQTEGELIDKTDHDRNGYLYHLKFMDDQGRMICEMTIPEYDRLDYEGQTYRINTEMIIAALKGKTS